MLERRPLFVFDYRPLADFEDWHIMKSKIINRSGFTLVEILVVIFIIGLLIALLMPAINGARETARASQCANNQKEISKAITHYELSKQRLPGVLNFINPSDPTKSPTINWVMALFADMGRMDLWQVCQEDIRKNNKIDSKHIVKVGELLCPSNSSIEPQGGLAYAINMGVYPADPKATPIDYSNRLFRNRAAWDTTAQKTEPDMIPGNLKSTSRLVMLSERLIAIDPTTMPANIVPTQWTYIPAKSINPGIYAGLEPLAFQWPADTLTDIRIKDQPNLPLAVPKDKTSPGLGSYHRGLIVVTFFDGHSEKLPDTTLCWNDAENAVLGEP